ncbi:glycosyltransferase [Brasilonema sp. CT11]|nr:glycosyltransferase [Brasilonema sp. CT11]
MISVITPVYNGEKFIESCIKVVIDQNCTDVEHIIVDGGSTDRTVEIIKQYAEMYPHIRWISEKDKGQSDAMNKGIAMARGEKLSVLNVDDYYESNVLNRVIEIFKSIPEPSFVVGNCNVWDDSGNLFLLNKPRNLSLVNWLSKPFFEENVYPVNPSAYFYHTSLHKKVGLYDVDEHYAMDLDFIVRAIQVASVKYVDENWGNFRFIEGTKTFNDIKKGESNLRINNILQKYQKKLPIYIRAIIFMVKQLRKIKYHVFFKLKVLRESIKYFWKHFKNMSFIQ